MLNEYQLLTFLTIAELQSFSKAANYLNVTQPTVTSRMKVLEEIVDCELFQRIGHEVVLTSEGELFKAYAQKILLYMTQAKEISNMTKAPVIRVGFSPGYCYSFIVELLKTIKSMGNIDIQVIEGYDSVDLNERLLAGGVDLIFSRDLITENADIESEFLFHNELVLLLPSNHPLNQYESLQLQHLNQETVISFRRNSQLWKIIDEKLLSVKGLTRIDVDNNEMLLKAVANNIGIGIIPKLGFNHVDSVDITIRKVDAFLSIPNSVYAQYRKNPHITKLAKKITYAVIAHKYAQL